MGIRQGRRRAAAITLLVVLGTVAAVSQACGGNGSGAAQATPTARPLPSHIAADGTPSFRRGTPPADFTPGAFGTPGAGPRGMTFNGIDSGLADFLGIMQDQLQSELSADGATMATVAQAHGKSRDDLKAFLTDQIKNNADQAVADGRMTQEQADTMIQDSSAQVDGMIDGNGFRGRFNDRGTPAPATP